EHPAETAVFRIPPEATVFSRERWSGAPLVAGFRSGAGAVLWVAVPPGERGFERFPFLLQALGALGLEPPFQSNRLWAFFDSSYRARADTDYLAARWRLAGIRGLHVAAWHYHEPDAERDQYLRRLIQSCHRRGILVYAWLELPHVSERFWRDHPEWREKTALGQDAHLDWRKLMNLLNRECFAAASAGVKALLGRFDWDGANLAELYFESLQGHENPSRFTPMNQDVRREFQEREGFDPIELFDASSPRRLASNPLGLRRFLDYRADLARRMQEEWLEFLATARLEKPDLDLVLTHVDDRFDSRMRDAVGADAASVLSLLDRHSITFLVEDPATVWHLGPERYREIAARYAPLTHHREKLAVDLNIVERYQDVYPTKQQAGAELYQLVNQAARSFPRVALYFENSIQAADAAWLSSAAAAVERWERDGDRHTVESPNGVGIRWKGPARVDGKPWPVGDGETVWVPPGRHTIESGSGEPALRLLDLTAELISAASLPQGLEFAYRSSARVFAMLNRRPAAFWVDGSPAHPATLDSPTGVLLSLPKGRHTVRVEGWEGYAPEGGSANATRSPACKPDKTAASVPPRTPTSIYLFSKPEPTRTYAKALSPSE
ncbi:MAG: hypothetical protein ABIG68_03255, partial [Acidobacteriota bacterium]